MQVSQFNVNALLQNRVATTSRQFIEKKKTFLTTCLHITRYSYKLFMRHGNKHNGKFNKQIIILMSSRKRQAFWLQHCGSINMLLDIRGKLNEPCPAVLPPCIIDLHAISCFNMLPGAQENWQCKPGCKIGARRHIQLRFGRPFSASRVHSNSFPKAKNLHNAPLCGFKEANLIKFIETWWAPDHLK